MRKWMLLGIDWENQAALSIHGMQFSSATYAFLSSSSNGAFCFWRKMRYGAFCQFGSYPVMRSLFSGAQLFWCMINCSVVSMLPWPGAFLDQTTGSLGSISQSIALFKLTEEPGLTISRAGNGAGNRTGRKHLQNIISSRSGHRLSQSSLILKLSQSSLIDPCICLSGFLIPVVVVGIT